MTSPPTAEIIPRHPSVRAPDQPGLPGAAWADLDDLLRNGSGTTWLSVNAGDAVHVRPIFAAWTGTTFVFASNPKAAKSRHVEANGRCSLSIDLRQAHLVIEGTAVRLTDSVDLARASRALHDVYGWPTTVAGDQLDAPYAAPSSGGPPFNAYEVTPTRAFAFPTDEQFDPTRFTFGVQEPA
jgi:hypothetical protein